ncbi:MAG: glycosyltransferase [Bacteroidales bacterium]
MSNSLAIVIPAYKASFLQKTFLSVANQTDKRFNLYIFNDASKEDIEGIIIKFQEILPFKYLCFKENLGLVSLPKQWKRCIENTANEPWLWLLPDDDVINPDCVEEFYRTTEQIGFNFDLIRFRTVHIDENDKTIRTNSSPPPIEPGFDYLIEKLNHRRNSTVAEYIFSREAYNKVNGFQEFPLGWTSDEALWFAIARGKGIYTCDNGLVALRQSHLNISNDIAKYNYTKFKAVYQFFYWLKRNDYFIEVTNNPDNKKKFIQSSQFYIFDFIKNYHINLSIPTIIDLARKNQFIWNDGFLRNVYRLFRFKLFSA